MSGCKNNTETLKTVLGKMLGVAIARVYYQVPGDGCEAYRGRLKEYSHQKFTENHPDKEPSPGASRQFRPDLRSRLVLKYYKKRLLSVIGAYFI